MTELENKSNSSLIITSRLHGLHDYINALKLSKISNHYLDIGMDVIDQSAFYLGLDDAIKLKATSIFKKIYESGFGKGRTIDLLALTSVYSACRMELIPITLDDIALITEKPKKDIAKTLRLFLNKVKISLPPLNPLNFIDRYSTELHSSKETRQLAATLLSLAYERRLIAGRDPAIVAAALIYISCIYTKEKMTQEELAKTANATSVSIRNYYKKFMRIVGKETLKSIYLMTKESNEENITKTIWNKYLLTFTLHKFNPDTEKTFRLTLINELLSNEEYHSYYLEKLEIKNLNNSKYSIFIIIWIEVSLIHSTMLSRNLQFKINEIFGTNTIFNVMVRFLESFIPKKDIGRQSSKESGEYFLRKYKNMKILNQKEKVDTTTIESLMAYLSEDDSRQNRECIIEKITELNELEKNKLLELCKENYLSRNPDLIRISLMILKELSRLDPNLSGRRKIASDLFQLKLETTDKNLLNLISECLKDLRYEETYDYDEVLIVMDLGIEATEIIRQLRKEPGDLLSISKKTGLKQIEIRDILEWLLREEYVTISWEGLSLKYNPISKKDLLSKLKTEYETSEIPLA